MTTNPLHSSGAASSAAQLFTSESVTEGHPDKICDAISDTILDALLQQDPHARVAVETLATKGLVHVAGEVTTTGYVEIPQLVRDTIKDIGYNDSAMGFDAEGCGVTVSIGQQSPEIFRGVFNSMEAREDSARDDYDLQGAGDQGLMFGYATDETPTLMPAPIWLAHRLSERLTEVRKDGTLPFLRPDGKTQVTIAYEGDRPVALDTVVISAQHDRDVSQQDLRAALERDVVAPVVESALDAGLDLDVSSLRSILNPSGEFVLGGPGGDAGLTGRKIIVDTYGGMARHGGGAFSGKDPSKVDRSGAYAMRWVAKNIVAAGLAGRAEVQVAYAIGRAHPVGLYVQTFGTEKAPLPSIVSAVREVFDLRPAAIIDALDLKRPIYASTAAHGHFGREEPDFTWERTDRVQDLRSAAGL